MPLTIDLVGEHIELLPERAIRIPRLNALLLSDVHLGKAAHFRAHGLAVPDAVFTHDLDRLASLASRYSDDIYIVGDLVHKTHNHEWERFAALRASWKQRVMLIVGNHDRFVDDYATSASIDLADRYDLGPFHLVHKPDDHRDTDAYGICGHEHPAIVLSGKSSQQIRLPAFVATSRRFLLPAFGRFTGTHVVDLEDEDRAWVLVDETIIAVPPRRLPA